MNWTIELMLNMRWICYCPSGNCLFTEWISFILRCYAPAQGLCTNILSPHFSGVLGRVYCNEIQWCCSISKFGQVVHFFLQPKAHLVRQTDWRSWRVHSQLIVLFAHQTIVCVCVSTHVVKDVSTFSPSLHGETSIQLLWLRHLNVLMYEECLALLFSAGY